MGIAGSAQGHFIRVLGQRDVLALAFGAIIGWSWVLLTGKWVATAGPGGAMAAFVIGGIAMILIALGLMFYRRRNPALQTSPETHPTAPPKPRRRPANLRQEWP